ncbi:AsmA-like C-terminal region [Roseovarius nanhaiticus]|uniref:AsmA-like C-terminal region n=1 Tax=Roseovarius nanhaiticus TaxID=573024 RepID=A0A1N7G5X7_9RHOB|nr:hypothetical protein [Roseovarius nanhaiticus]SEK36214.1 AsmA-like C-terminal region [Roseovarius nanhaiticus]SIS08017.1 AsmA-like C-terminal region [Roseovarius nanhaiticus]
MSSHDTDQSASAEGRAPEHAGRRHRRRRRRRKAGIWSLLSVIFLAGAGTLYALSFLGTPITLPDWLRGRIVERINTDAGDLQVDLDEMVVVIEEGWVPRLALRGVTLRGADRRVIARLAELGGTLAMRPLLSGELRPSQIRLSGLQVNLRRNDSGEVGVQLGGIAAAPRAAQTAGGAGGAPAAMRDPGALIAEIDGALARPAMAALRGIYADNMTLRYEDARTGRAWTIDGGQVEATRQSGMLRVRANFALLGARAYPSTLEFSIASRIGSRAAQLALNFSDLPAGDLAMQSPALTWLDALDAPISGALRARLDGAGDLGPLNASLQIGKGALRPTAGTTPIAFDKAGSYFTYDPKAQTIAFEAVTVESKWVTARAEGTAHMIGGQNGWPDELQAQLRVTDIVADPADLYDTPIALDSAALDMRLRLAPFHLTIGQLSLSDQGRHLVLNGDLRGQEDGWNLALDGRMDGIDKDRLMALWPEAAVPNTRSWVDENVARAALSNVQLAVRSLPKHRADVFLGFDFDQMQARFMKQMPPIENMKGKARLLDGRFVITADEGTIDPGAGGRIDIAGTSFAVPNVNREAPPADVRLRTQSTITAALTLLDNEPFRFLSKQGRPATLADGRAAIAADLGFPLIKDVQTEDVAYDVTGILEDVSSEVLVPNRTLSAERLDLRVGPDGLRVAGQGRLGAVPFDGAYTADLGPESAGSTVDGTITLSQAFSDEFGIGLPPGSLTGGAEARVRVDLPPGAAGGTSETGAPSGSFTLNSNLAGLGLSLSQLNWSLPRAAQGTLEVRGQLGDPLQIEALTLDAPGLSATGRVALGAGGLLDRATFSRVRVGGWLDAPVTLVGRGRGAAPGVEVSGGVIDLRRADLAGGGAGQGGPIALSLARLTVSDGIALDDFRARLSTAGGLDGTFSGRVNGGAAINGQIVPQNGRSAFRIVTADAGGVLGSAGLLKQARGGEMELIMTPAGAPGTYEGRLSGGDIWLTEAPALAELLSALSVVGLLEQMSGSGIHFSDVDARFRLGPERLTVYSSSAVGASMGISMDGYYYPGSKRMDMQGVVSPLYIVNAIGGMFTRQGEGLVGVNYTLTGAATDPTVSVNPLSLLTPGMFREIFRRQPPERRAPEASRPAQSDGGEEGGTAAAPPSAPREINPGRRGGINSR